MNNKNIYTDLALEEREKYEDNVEIKGVKIEEERDDLLKMTTTVVDIVNHNGEKAMGKPKGKYITIESRLMKEEDAGVRNKLSEKLTNHLNKFISSGKIKNILIVGLGNSQATPDALGPRVAEKIQIKEGIYCISPGVLAQTGMETHSIIKGVVAEVNPDIVIAIDSLAARNLRRVTTTIQLTDTGIIPGSGIGNHRVGINRETLGKKVIAIGVPMVVSGATIVNDTMENLLKILSSHHISDSVSGILENYSTEEKYQLFEELLSEETEQVFVTPKDIDEIVENLSGIIAHALNEFCKNNLLVIA